MALARWYAIPRGLCVPRARSGCPSGSPCVPVACVCARAAAASTPPPPGWCGVRTSRGPGTGRWSGRSTWSVPLRVSCPGPLLCLACLAGGGPVPVPPYFAWGCGGGGRASSGGPSSTVARGVWGQALPLPRLPAHWAGCWGPLSTCCGRRRVGVGALLCPLGLHALWGLHAAGVVGGPPPTWLGAVRPPWGGSVAFVCRGAGWGGGGGRAPCPPFVRPGGACRAGGRSASFRPSAFPGQATKRVSLVLFCPWAAWPPIPLRFVLARLQRARSVRRPGALARARLFSAAPVGAGGWGGGGGSRSGFSLGRGGGGGGGHPPCLGGWGPGPLRLAGRWGGWGGGVAPRPPCSPSGWWPAVPHPGPPRVVGALSSGVRVRLGSRSRPGVGGGEERPVDRSPGAPADLNPPSALPVWAVVTGGSCGARPPYCSGAPPCAAPKIGARVAPARWRGLALRPRPPREQAAGGAGGRGVQVQPHRPPPRRGPFWRGGGVPSAPGGRRAAPVAPKLGGGSRGGGGGGGGGGPPFPPPPRRVSACHPLSPACPPRGILVLWGLPGGRGRWARSSRPPTGQCGRGGGRGGEPPRPGSAPVLPGPASDRAAPFAPSWAPPVRRRPAAGRACGRLPRPWCPRTPGAAASSGGVRGRRFFGLPPSALGPKWEGGGEWGGPSGPLAPPPDSRGGGGMAVPALGASHRLGGRTLPPPPFI